MSIPIVKNILAFLDRVDVKGREAYAFVEAHQFVQLMLKDLENPGPSLSSSEQAVD